MKIEKYVSTGRNNVGLDITPNSLVAQGDFPTKNLMDDTESHSWPLVTDEYMDGDIAEGVSVQKCIYAQPGAIYGVRPRQKIF